MTSRTRTKLTPEQKALSDRLAEIKTMPSFYRRTLIRGAASDYGVCEETIYRWMRINTSKDRKHLLNRRGRSDEGRLRIPEEAVVQALIYFEVHQNTSASKAHAYLIKNHPKAMTYTNSKGEEKVVSTATIRKIQKSFLRLWTMRMISNDDC